MVREVYENELNELLTFTVVSPGRKSFQRFPAYLLPKIERRTENHANLRKWLIRWRPSLWAAGRNGRPFSLLPPASTSTRSMNK